MDSHVDKLMMSLHSLMTIPQALYSKIDVTLYGDVIVFARCPREFMMWCPLKLAYEVDLENNGVW